MDLFAVRVDGSSERRLTDDPEVEADGQWSPDGSKIAFRSGGGISVMNADGTNRHLLTSRTNDLPDTFTWSPDGARIAFISVEGSASEIDVVDADGTNRIVLRRPNPPIAYTQLAWSPDGTKIAFVMGSGIRRRSPSWMRTGGTSCVDSDPSRSADVVSRWIQDLDRRGGRCLRGRCRGREHGTSHGIRNGNGQLVTRRIGTRDLRQRRDRGHEGGWHGAHQDRSHGCARDESDVATRRVAPSRDAHC